MDKHVEEYGLAYDIFPATSVPNHIYKNFRSLWEESLSPPWQGDLD